MHAWESIQTAVEHIEQGLCGELPVAELAKEASLSPFYFQRLFARLVGKPLGEYIKLRRLARASERLLEPGTRIVDVALETGFASHEALTRAFKAAYGMTPEQYRAAPVRLNHFEKPDLSLLYVMVDEGVPVVADGVVLEVRRETPAATRCFAGIARPVHMAMQLPPGAATGISELGEIWDELHRVQETIPGRLHGGEALGASYRGDAPEGCFTYFAGVETRVDTPPPPPFAVFCLPVRPYVVCRFEAETWEELVPVALDRALNYVLRWMERYGLRVSERDFSAELTLQRKPPCMELWLPLAEE